MAKPKPLKCDRCGKEMGDLHGAVDLLYDKYGCEEVWYAICPDCAELLKLWLKGGKQ